MKNVEDIYRLSSMQAGMLFHCLAAPGDPVYFEQYLAELDGELDVPRFQRAWTTVVARHPALRTAFVWEGLKQPMQVVRRQVAVPWQVVDWSDRAAGSESDALDELLAADRARPFVLSEAPLMRLTLVRFAPDRHALLWSFHHLLIDGWSCALVQRDVAECYAAESLGLRRPADAPKPYGDYIRWLAGRDDARAEAFWRGQLAGAPPTPLRFEPPADPEREPDQTAQIDLALTPEATARIVQAARSQGLALNTVCQAAWALVLARHGGADEVLFGATVSGRPPEIQGVERMVGLFINTLCVRVKLPRHQAVGGWLARLQVEAAEAREHEHTPLAEAQRWCDGRPGSPPFETLLVYESYPRGRASDGPPVPVPLRVTPLRTIEKTNYPVTLLVNPGERLLMTLVVQRRRVSVDAMSRVLARFAAALDALLADPARELGAVSLLPADEREQVVRGWNATARAWADGKTSTSLAAWLEAQAARTPHALAVRAEAESWTYEELHARASQIARRLQRLGVGPEARVGVWIERSPLLVAALVGVVKSGGAYVPLDPAYPAARLAFQIADAAVHVVLTTSAHAAEVPEGPYAVDVLDAAAAPWRDEPATAPPSTVWPDQLAYIIYTSGSTGQPKGAMNTHRGIGNRLAWMQDAYALTPADRVLQKTSSSFDVSVWEFFWPLGVGATLVLAKPGGQQDPAYLADLVRRTGVTVMHFVPSMLDAFVAAGGLAACDGVRLIVSSGEALPGPLAARCLAGWPGRLDNLYGPTEAAVDVTWQPCGRTAQTAGSIPIGRPIANTQIYVRDAEGEPAPVGVAGELWLGGVQVGRGYWNRPELTAERFVPDPFGDAPGRRLYRTGDLARYRADGACEFLGRADHQVKLRGFRVEPGEVEAAMRAQPGVRDALVQLREDVPGEPRLVAYAVADGPDGVPVANIQQALRAALPDYMVPSAIVALDAFPLTPNGKVDRGALPAPGGARRATREYIPPRDALELELVRMWEALLRTRPIGVRDDFFEAGGHSLLVLQLVAQIERAFEIRASLAELVQGTTIERLAAIVRRRRAGADERFVLMQADGGGTPIVAVVPAGGTLACYVPLAEAMGRERPFYALQPRATLQDASSARTIELMARADLDEIRRVRPRGPYALVGWSMGGLVAYEMACLLREAGEDVALVALLDVGVPDPDQPPRDATELAVETGARELGLDLAELGDAQGEARLDALLDLARQRGKLADEVDMRWVRWLADGFRMSVEATGQYRPRRYDGRVVLVRAIDHQAESDDTFGWGGLADGGVDVHWIAGAHHNIVRPPYVAAIADRLRACLDADVHQSPQQTAVAAHVVDVG